MWCGANANAEGSAAVDYRAGQTGTQFEHALTKAARLGPSEPAVQRIVADYGLAVWDEVGPGTREAVQAVVANGMRRNPKEMLQIAGRRGRLAVACRHIADAPPRGDRGWSKLCGSRETPS